MRKLRKITSLLLGCSMALASVGISNMVNLNHTGNEISNNMVYAAKTIKSTTKPVTKSADKSTAKTTNTNKSTTKAPEKTTIPENPTINLMKPTETSEIQDPTKIIKEATVLSPEPDSTLEPDTSDIANAVSTPDISANYYDFPVDADGDGIKDINIKIHVGISGAEYMREHWYDYFSETTVNPYANPTLSELNNYYISGYQIDITETDDHSYDVTIIIKDGFHLEGSYKKSITFTLPEKSLVDHTITSAEANIGYLASNSNDQLATFTLMPREDGKTIMLQYSAKSVRENGENLLYLLPSWGCPVADLSYKITYKKKQSGIPVAFIGNTKDTNKIDCIQKENVITGKYEDVINSKYVILTFSKEKTLVSEGSEDNNNTDLLFKITNVTKIIGKTLFILALSLMVISLAFIIWNVRKILESPKEDDFDYEYMNPLNTELLNGYGKATSKGIVALLINLAVRGYIHIEQTDTDYIIHKNSPYDGDDENEELFLEMLFEEAENNKNKDSVSCNSPLFRTACKELKAKTNCKENISCIYNTSRKGILFAWLPVISVILFLLSVLLGGIAQSLAGYGDTGLFNRLLFISSWALFAILVVLKIKFAFFCRFYTEEGLELLREILAEKKQILDIDTDMLPFILEDDPDYAYHILPYAYIWNFHWKWERLFSMVPEDADYTDVVCTPEWYLDGRSVEVVEEDADQEIAEKEKIKEQAEDIECVGKTDNTLEENPEENDDAENEDKIEEDFDADLLDNSDAYGYDFKEFFFEEKDIPKKNNPMVHFFAEFAVAIRKCLERKKSSDKKTSKRELSN